jgi:hypothetical protein
VFVSWERVYRAVAQIRRWYVLLSRGRCIATAVHATGSLNAQVTGYFDIGRVLQELLKNRNLSYLKSVNSF